MINKASIVSPFPLKGQLQANHKPIRTLNHHDSHHLLFVRYYTWQLSNIRDSRTECCPAAAWISLDSGSMQEFRKAVCPGARTELNAVAIPALGVLRCRYRSTSKKSELHPR
jgi:hypothetical protein